LARPSKEYRCGRKNKRMHRVSPKYTERKQVTHTNTRQEWFTQLLLKWRRRPGGQRLPLRRLGALLAPRKEYRCGRKNKRMHRVSPKYTERKQVTHTNTRQELFTQLLLEWRRRPSGQRLPLCRLGALLARSSKEYRCGGTNKRMHRVNPIYGLEPQRNRSHTQTHDKNGLE